MAEQRPWLSDGLIVVDRHTLADLDANLAGDDEEMTRRFGWYPARSTADTVRAALLRWQEQWESDGRTRALSVREAATGELAGGCELRIGDDGVAEMSYWTFPAFRGRGLASRAVRLTSAYAFSELAVERIELHVEVDNIASRRVAHKAGFTEEGVLRSRALIGGRRRDMVIYSRLASDGLPDGDPSQHTAPARAPEEEAVLPQAALTSRRYPRPDEVLGRDAGISRSVARPAAPLRETRSPRP